MSWRKHFRVVNPNNSGGMGAAQPPRTNTTRGGDFNSNSKFSSYLPEVYAGHPNRIQRYMQYEDMDRDSVIRTALDILADFCTQAEENTGTQFDINYLNSANETEVKLLKTALQTWTRKNKFRKRLWEIFRNVMKNGDQFYIRDPETFEWLWVSHYDVELVKVDETKGKEPTEYLIKNLSYNRITQLATRPMSTADGNLNGNVVSTQPRGPLGNPGVGASGFALSGGDVDPRTNKAVGVATLVNAKDIVHLSLSSGMDDNWPFGSSILDGVFKSFKQKELLEDAVIIYRVQRAPERRIFKIDVGNMNPAMANAHVERIKNEVHQRRIPNRTGGGSSIGDAAYNPLCLDMETRVPLLDGRTLSITELAIEHQAGKQNWVYSCDPITGKIVPGNISWAGVTRKNAQVIKVTLDNGKTITCTPDHKFPVLGKGFVEAQFLTPQDSLISHETRLKSLSGDADRSYEQIYDHDENKWKFTHRMVGEFFRDLGKHQKFTFCPEMADAELDTVHHKDYSRYNNDPRNLAWMNHVDHRLFHSHTKKEYWQSITTEESNRIKNKIRTTLKNTLDNMTQEEKDEFSAACSSGQRKRWDNIDRESQVYKDMVKTLGDASRERAIQPKYREILLDNIKVQQAAPWMNIPFKFNHQMLQRLVEVVVTNDTNRLQTIDLLKNDQKFIDLLIECNPKQTGINKVTYDVTWSKLERIILESGYKNWKDFKKKSTVFNHRITSIEWMDEPMDTGCITVDQEERWHSHHTFATEAGVYTKNSMLEDYFFAVTPEGRGSSIETLAGGDAVGEIGDLSFFDRKLKEGLGIPSSYLPGGDDPGATYNDGKLGAALIQEFRFNRYCMRLQNMLSPVFDTEFKAYLKSSGIVIEEDLFELVFNPPQNFAKYRQIDLDAAQMNVYTQVADIKHLSERFKLKRFLNLSEDEMVENERLWKEEHPDKMKKATGVDAMTADEDLSSVGVRSSDVDLNVDFDSGDIEAIGDDESTGLEGEDITDEE